MAVLIHHPTKGTNIWQGLLLLLELEILMGADTVTNIAAANATAKTAVAPLVPCRQR